ncbi:Hypothetical predicted protein [Podarcis lilfordi]|uniref:ribonuclease H n=1 Tax=Podarcis lilfordi TaxID=74358 RepID=A0AA35LN20_9SAUR|nr:Hypothetical predicted protein [Podarcis lilfordi]
MAEVWPFENLCLRTLEGKTLNLALVKASLWATVEREESPERFCLSNGLLYREVLDIPSRGGNEIRRELVIPQAYREMLKAGIITPSESPWAAPIVLLDKPGGSIRFCLDYRKLNHVTKADAYPMPRLDDLIEAIGQCHYITCLDLTKGYYQVKMDPKDQEKTAFRSPLGLFEFKVMPFGLKNAPATFQRLVDKILNGLREFTVAYLDDIAVYSPTWDKHKEHLGIVLQRIKEKKVRAFLGLASYYRKFIPKFSELAAPLSDLTRKKEPDKVKWTAACQQAFDALKSALTSDPVLVAPNYDREFTVFTAASNAGIGAVLCQQG